MDGQKVENLLNLAMGSTQREKEKSQNLMTGYNENERTWELIIRYDQSRSPLPEELAEVIPLSFGYGIIRVPERSILRSRKDCILPSIRGGRLPALRAFRHPWKPAGRWMEAEQLWPSLTRVWTIFIRISGEKTEVQGSWHCGIRRWTQECLRKVSGQERNLPGVS